MIWFSKEGITNVLGCGLLYVGVNGLHKAGLKDFELTTK